MGPTVHVVMLAYGSRGDVQPFLALGAALLAAGHSAALAAPERFAGAAAALGLGFAPLPGDVERLARELADEARGSVPRMVATVRRHVLPLAAEVMRRVREAVAGCDVVVHSFLTTAAGHMAALEAGVPDISAQLFPFFTEYDAFPNVGMRPPGRGPALNRLSHRLAEQVFWQSSRLSYAWLRRSTPGLGPRALPRPTPGRGTPLLLAYSRHLVAPPDPARAPRARTTGFWALPEPTHAPPELERFLAGGPPPVYVGFGSMATADAARLTAAVLGALQLTGRRGVLLRGWAGLGARELPQGVLALDEAAHGWLFPRVAAVVHHGGSGTTGAGARAGVPTVVVPFTADQPFWGDRIWRAGAGPPPLPAERVSAAGLAAAIRATESPMMISRAAALGERVRAEGGAVEAVRAIEELVLSPRGQAARR